MRFKKLCYFAVFILAVQLSATFACQPQMISQLPEITETSEHQHHQMNSMAAESSDIPQASSSDNCCEADTCNMVSCSSNYALTDELSLFADIPHFLKPANDSIANISKLSLSFDKPPKV